MSKKDVYYWKPRDGKGTLKIDRLYVDGEEIPHELMDSGTLATLVKSGDIKTTPFDVSKSVEKDSDLKKEVKAMKATIVKLEKQVKDDATTIADNKTDADADKATIVKLEKQVKELTEKAEK